MLALCAAALPAAAAEYALAPGQQAVGAVIRYVVRQGDVFPDIARRFDIGYTALAAANPGVDPWFPGVGRQITIPALHILPAAPRTGIVINLAQWRLYYFPPGGGSVMTFPLGLGQIGKKTPLGVTRVVRKEPSPTWYPPASIRAEQPDLPAFIGPGPDNPLGAFALHLGWKNYLLHGTNKPDGVGRNVSHGCIRHYPEDIAKLFDAVAVGTPVRTVKQPATAGWLGDALYVEVYPSQRQTEEIDVERPATPEPAAGVRAIVRAAAGPYADNVDWAAVDEAANTRTGMPVRVAQKSGYVSEAAPRYQGGAASAYEPDAAPSYDREWAQYYDNQAAQSSGRQSSQYYDNQAAQSSDRQWYQGDDRRAAAADRQWSQDYDRDAAADSGSATAPYAPAAEPNDDGGTDSPYGAAAGQGAARAQRWYDEARQSYQRAQQSYDRALGQPYYQQGGQPFYRDLGQ